MAGFTCDDQLAGHNGVCLLSSRIPPPGQLVAPILTALYNDKGSCLRKCYIRRRIDSKNGSFLKKILA
jgi:hypothetical protein